MVKVPQRPSSKWDTIRNWIVAICTAAALGISIWNVIDIRKDIKPSIDNIGTTISGIKLATDNATELAYRAIRNSENATAIASDSLEENKRVTAALNEPNITAHYVTFNEGPDKQTDRIIVLNRGGKIRSFVTEGIFIVSIRHFNPDVELLFPITGYYTNENPTFQLVGDLAYPSYNGNYSAYLNFRDSFKAAATSKKLDFYFTEYRILRIKYELIYPIGQQCEEYFLVDIDKNPDKDQIKIKSIINKASVGTQSISSIPDAPSTYIFLLNGKTFWDWYYINWFQKVTT